MDEKQNIYQRINKVRESNAYIKKDKEVDGKYTVVTHDHVTKEIRADLIAQGVVIVPWLDSDPVMRDTGKTMGKNPVWMISAIYVVRFVNVDDPKDFCEVRVLAHAEDTGDKGPGKLLSYAVKMAILKLFAIESGDREEDRIDSDKTGGMNETDFKTWTDTIDIVETPEQATKVWKQIVAACKAKKDERSVTVLRTYLSAVTARKGIKSGQQRITGGADAGATTH